MAEPLTERAPDSETHAVWYKVVELSTVTDETIEETLNERTAEGWLLDGIYFAMRESSKRPAMAFVIFTRRS